MAPAKRRMVQTTLFGGKDDEALASEEAGHKDKQQRTLLFDPKKESLKRNKADPNEWLSDFVDGTIKPERDVPSTGGDEASSTAHNDVKTEPKSAPIGTDDLSLDTFNPYMESEKDWKTGRDEYLFNRLVLAWRLVESLRNSGTGYKRKSSVILANSYRSILAHSPKDYVLGIYLTLQKLGPPYLSKETGVGDAALIKCIAETYGRTEQHVKSELQKTGDLGIIAHQSKCSMTTLFPPARLSISSVWIGLHKIADSKGASAQSKKREHLKHLLIGAVDEEPKYLIRFLSKQMRMGVRAATVISGLARALLTIRPKRVIPKLLLDQISSQGKLSSADPPASSPPASDPPQPPPSDSTQLTSEQEELFVKCVHELKQAQVTANLSKYLSQLNLKDSSIMPSDDEVTELEEVIKGCYSRFPNLGLIILYALHSLSRNELISLCQITPGIPVSPMLARPTKSYTSVLDYMLGQDFRAEFKYDGERCQIHIEKNDEGKINVHLFSRNMESLDEKYPDVIEAVMESACCGKDAILDSEVVAFNTETKKIESFQVLSTRKRKDVSTSSVTIRVCLYVFDCLRLDQRAVTSLPLIERLELVKKSLKENADKICYARGKNISSGGGTGATLNFTTLTPPDASTSVAAAAPPPAATTTSAPPPTAAGESAGGLEELEALMNEAVEQSTEGLMIKSLTGPKSFYEPSQRTVNWLKLKKDYLDNGVCDSLDLAVIGAFYGMGRRSGGFGCFLMAVYEASSDTYRSVCKVATGFTDADLDQFTKQLPVAEVRPKSYDCKLQPDVWIQPGIIWEIKCADLSISPVHTACSNLQGPALGKGIGLRFPRFIRQRDDKNLTTTPGQVLQLYHDQFAGESGANIPVDDNDDLLI